MDRRIFSVSKVVLFALMAVFLLVSFACEPGGGITIENHQDQTISIFFTHVRADGSLDNPSKQGAVTPNATRKFFDVFLDPEWMERIEAREQSGKIVFSHDYKMGDLEKIGWKITIPP